jgi:N-acetylneuraminic acid mutarotase
MRYWQPFRSLTWLGLIGLTVTLAGCGGGGNGSSPSVAAGSTDSGGGTGSGTGSSGGSSGSGGGSGGSGGSGSGSGGTSQAASTCSVTATQVSCTPWIWQSGSSGFNAAGVYGTQGTPSTSNFPGARQQGVSWTDASGNLWLFGGLGQDSVVASDVGLLNDLWRFSPSTGQWTWLSGSDTANPTGTYGLQGVPSASNMPPPRYEAVSWTDTSGNLWLFGGLEKDDFSVLAPGDPLLNDLWRYDPSSNQWTWMSGSNQSNTQGNYGTLGTAAASTVPPPRVAAATWTDASGNLWLFGGTGFDATVYQNIGQFNDLWVFRPSSGQWTWMGGQSPATEPELNGFYAGMNYRGNYGTRGVGAAGNYPGARADASAWVDAAGNFWLFAGDGWDSADQFGVLNDLWEYNPTTNVWTWVSGSSSSNTAGIYGTQGVPATTNMPGSRIDAANWSDSSGNVWLFGGGGLDGAGGKGALSDLWEYSPSTNQWTWVNGANTADTIGVYGTQGAAATSNAPGGRAGALFWTDTAGNHWLFGGYGLDNGGTSDLTQQQYLNDLWRF